MESAGRVQVSAKAVKLILYKCLWESHESATSSYGLNNLGVETSLE